MPTATCARAEPLLVYGDRGRTGDPREEIGRLRAEVASAAALPAGLERHAALVAALIACGELAQGLADAAFEACGEDAPDPGADLALEATRALAEAVVRSWRTGFAGGLIDAAPLDRLAGLSLPARVTLKQGEGYAFYALYPEAYAEAAAALDPAPTAVVGLRSIGSSLAAVVAAALGAERVATVRPVGPPFARTLSVAPALRARLLSPSPARVAIVDEGPGLSGSSFGAALDWAEAAGVPRDRLAAFPGHAGDLGPEASAPHRARWAILAQPHVSFDRAILPRLADWVADLTGPATEPLQDLSGGAWRALRYTSEADWPAVNAAQERRKFLLRSGRGAFLLKFAGLGRIGARKLARARRLAAAGLTVAPLGLRHGFLVEPWVEPARPPTRASIIDALPDHLRARLLFSSDCTEFRADLAALHEISERNSREAFGVEAAATLTPWRAVLPGLEARARPVVTDNRLHAQEWITAPDGRPLKTDALDHAEAHDLMGCQDIAWDLAGAAVELELDPDALDALVRAVDGEGRITPDFLRFHRLAYLAFQLGAADMAARAHAGWPEEAARLGRERARYEEGLRRMLSA